jgi:hypothetical protein
MQSYISILLHGWTEKLATVNALTVLMANAAADPNPTREFMLGEPCLNALKPSKSISGGVP